MYNRNSEFILLFFSSICCGILLLIRIVYWQNAELDLAELSVSKIKNNRGYTFAFLAWNLFLAWIPYMISITLPWIDKVMGKKFLWITGGIVGIWLLFFPNAPYIVTDLLHLRPRPLVPLWYDLILILSFAWVGLILGIFSLLHVQRWVQNRFGKNYDAFLAITLIPLCSFGVYLGRFLRWNSWEVFSQPQVLLLDFYYLLTDMDSLGMALLTTGCFSLLLFMIYLPIKKIQNK